ncbi:hypothetical protein [Streptomyces sp. NPDC005548]|uniref:hypothetical protein n=1 Tax=Streptomyces sp. NPDC005548 TaxID=3364724 RepID=UPI0036CC43DF
MGASPRAFEVLAVRLQAARTPTDVDLLLDRWVDLRDRATEWDAHRWGFTYSWCERELAELDRRARLYVGPTPMDQEGTRL